MPSSAPRKVTWLLVLEFAFWLVTPVLAVKGFDVPAVATGVVALALTALSLVSGLSAWRRGLKR